MRLIDADVLMAEWEEPRDWLDREQVLRHYTWFKVVIESQPTIEAVPTGCEGCVYDVDDHTPDPCYECKRSYTDNYKERTDETD